MDAGTVARENKSVTGNEVKEVLKEAAVDRDQGESTASEKGQGRGGGAREQGSDGVRAYRSEGVMRA
eukprot:3180376-Pleurochrysis_carterae.AAC.3